MPTNGKKWKTSNANSTCGKRRYVLLMETWITGKRRVSIEVGWVYGLEEWVLLYWIGWGLSQRAGFLTFYLDFSCFLLSLFLPCNKDLCDFKYGALSLEFKFARTDCVFTAIRDFFRGKNNEHLAHLNVLHRLRPQPLLEANILYIVSHAFFYSSMGGEPHYISFSSRHTSQ